MPFFVLDFRMPPCFDIASKIRPQGKNPFIRQHKKFAIRKPSARSSPMPSEMRELIGQFSILNILLFPSIEMKKRLDLSS